MNHLNDVLDRFQQASIAVIGDICLDLYYTVSAEKSERSLETGLQTRAVSTFRHGAGGAGNVAVNCKALGASRVDLYGVLGDDPFGEALQGLLTSAGICCDNLQVQKADWHTHVYHKVYAEGREEPRFDIGNFNQTHSVTVRELLQSIESNVHSYDVVIINEQVVDGYHNREFQRGLAELIVRYNADIRWISDCRHLNRVYSGSIRKLNIHEAEVLFLELHPGKNEAPETREILQWLRQHWGKPVVITQGEDGASAIDDFGTIWEIPGVNILGPRDSVGAGDAFLAAFALCLAAGEGFENALTVSNLAAAVSVTKVQETGHPTADEVLCFGEAPDYRYNPNLARDERKAHYFRDSPVELIEAQPLPFPKIAIFDHDGTISTLRQGWETVMEETSIRAILGPSIASVSLQELGEVRALVSEMIDKTTGVQTIVQMHHLRDLIRSCSYVEEAGIADPSEYKRIYNEQLIEMVGSRIELFEKGLLDISDLTLKGALAFLTKLKGAGVRLFLASGTDEEDVRREAGILGYADLFDGGIFGSVGDVRNDPKRLVIEKIVSSLPSDIGSEACCVFGDGPVEMREASKRGFSRIGLVSDEKVRFGANPAKRSRLILGGAQVLIPDFSWTKVLSEAIGWEK